MGNKKKKRVFCPAAAALIAALLIMISGGCEAEIANTIARVSAMSAPSVKDPAVQAFEKTAVQNAQEAKALFGELMLAMKSISTTLTDTDKEVFETSFKAKYENKSSASWFTEKGANYSASFNTKIKDQAELLGAIKKTSTSVKAAGIEGSNEGSISTTQQLNRYFSDYAPNDDDKMSYTVSASRTFKISDGFAEGTVNGGNYQLAGIIKTYYHDKYNDKMKDHNTYKYEETSNIESKVAATLSFSCGNKGAIFRFSIAGKDNKENRSLKVANTVAFSTVEVYDKDGTPLKSCNFESTFALEDKTFSLIDIAESFAYNLGIKVSRKYIK